MPITFHHADVKVSLRNKTALKKFILRQTGKSSGSSIHIAFVFCSDKFLLALNQKYLRHNYYTDILTFPLAVNEHSLVAEIYISTERVKENSLKFNFQSSKGKTPNGPFNPKSKIHNRQFETELLRVIFHGVLHLLGYKDKTKTQQREMRSREEEWMKKFALGVSRQAVKAPKNKPKVLKNNK